MGAKTWMLAYADTDIAAELKASPPLDREATAVVAAALFPKLKLEPLPDGTLSLTNPPDDQVYVARLAGVTLVAAKEFLLDRPSQLPKHYLHAVGAKTGVLHAMHSVVDWFAFAVWQDGHLIRSLSVSPESGVIEDIGEQLPFEKPYWGGQHPVTDTGDEDEEPYPLPFHPLELGEAALREFFGYQLEGHVDAALIDAETIPLMHFKRKKSFFRLW